MTESIFTTQTPSTPDQNDANAYTLGTVIVIAVDGDVLGIRWYFPTTLPTGSVRGVLYSWTNDTSGTELARATFVSPVAGTWNQVLFAAPVAVTAGGVYVAAVHTPDHYVFTTGYFNGHSEVNGNLTAPETQLEPFVRRNGKFNGGGGSEPAFPNDSSNGACYFADLIFDADSASVTGELAAILPSLDADSTAAGIVRGNLTGVLPSALAGLSGGATAVATVAATLPTMTGLMAGDARANAALGVTLPRLTASCGSPVQSAPGRGSVVLVESAAVQLANTGGATLR